MKKNNLFESNPKTYIMQSTEREAYETQFNLLLKVKDSGNAMEDAVRQNGYESTDEVMQNLYDGFTDHKLGSAISKEFDQKKYNIHISIADLKYARIAKVKIDRRRVQEKIRDGLSMLAKRIIGEEYYPFE